MEHQWMERATVAAGKVYIRFLSEVLEKHVTKDREGGALDDKSQRKIDKGTHIDRRVVRLMSISGKGGVAANPEKQKIYDKYYNVSLLDHLLSVTRGSLLLSALDWMGQNPDMDSSVLNRRLTVMAVIGFMHDSDKDLELPRNAPLEIENMEERMERYGIADFLKGAEVSLSASQIRYLVEKVEGTQAHRHAPDTLPPREFESLPSYVRMADQLDSAWLTSDPEKGGFRGVMRCLENESLRSNVLKKWREIRLFDPHHPFLLDELQRCMSRFSLRLSGVPPLIEVHQDGHLFMLIPESGYKEIVEKSVNMLCSSLPFNLYLNVSNRGIPALYNGQPSHEELAEFIENGLKSRDLSDLFKIKRDMIDELKESLDDLLADIGLQPRWAEKVTTQLTTLYATFKDFEEADKEWLYRAAHLVLLLNLKVDAKPKNAVPDSPEREAELLKIVEEEPPDWIKAIDKRASRRTLTGLWVTAMAEQDEDVLEKVWGEEDGLLKKWLEGHEKRPGFNQFISGDGIEVVKGVKRRMNLLLSGQRVTVENENEKGRCAFTDEPVPFGKTISQAMKLYGIKVSAFSGRDNRPESVISDQSHTNVGFCSVAEHKLRSEVHELQGGKDDGVPTLISSPTTCGLFGGLGLTDDRAMGAMSLYDLNRLEIKKGKVLRGFETYRSRYRMARLERMPESLEGQVNIMRMLLNATRRMGRPIHVFRGLPVLQKAYFYYDAMPDVLIKLLGGNALGLEQIPMAIRQLDIANDILDTPGRGYDALKLYAMPKTRFGAICFASCYLRDREEKKPKLRAHLETEFFKYMEGKQNMSDQDGALIKLGQAAAGIQKNPGGRASGSDELLVFKICLDTVNAARKVGQTDTESLIFAVASELETNLVRRDKAAAREHRKEKSLRDGCMDVAEIFVNDVWLGVLKGRSPSQKSRRVLSAIYRMAFLKANKEQSEKKSENKKEKK